MLELFRADQTALLAAVDAGDFANLDAYVRRAPREPKTRGWTLIAFTPCKHTQRIP